MSRLKVIIAPDKRLKQKAMRVEKFDANLKAFANDLFETMHAHDCGGMAAIQVEDDPRFSYDNVPAGFRPQPNLIIVGSVFAVNAQIVWQSEEKMVNKEGCASIPNLPVEVERPAQVHVKYQDLDGKECIIACTPNSYESACFQHEIDHNNGILTPDHASSMQQLLLWKKFDQISKMVRLRR